MMNYSLPIKTVSKSVYTLALIAGFALTAIGLADLAWPQAMPWDSAGSQLRFLGFLFFSATAVFLLALCLRLTIYASATCMGAVLVISAGAVGPLLVVIIFATASALLGRWVFEKLGARVDSWVTFFLFGAGIYGTAVGLLAHFPVMYPGTMGCMLALPVILDHRRLMQWIREFGEFVFKPCLQSSKDKLLDLSISALALVFILVALMPEVGPDALAAHLFIPAHLLHKHQWGFDASKYVWAVTPMLGDWIFSATYLLGGETATRLTNIGFIFALGWLIRDLVRWAGGVDVGVRWAVLIFLSSPLTFTEGSSLFIESVWASFLLAGMLATLQACSADHRSNQTLTLAGALLGFSLAAKAVTFTYLPVLLLPIIWNFRTWKDTGFAKALLPGLALFLLFGGIPYITAWKLTGNPVFPFFNQIFNSPLFSNVNFEDTRWGKGLTWDFIYRVTFQTGKYLEATPGAAGFQWLLLFIPCLLILIIDRHKRGLGLIVLALVSIGLCFHSIAYLRYIFPSFILLISAIAINFQLVNHMGTVQVYATHIIATLTVLLNLIFFTAGPFVYRDFPIYSIFSDAQKDAYLNQRLPIRNAVTIVNSLNIEKTPVAVFAYPQVAGLSADAFMASWYNPSFNGAYTNIKTKQDAVDLLVDNKIDFIIAAMPSNEEKDQQALISSVTTQITRIGAIKVLKINDDLRFTKEMLQNPDFSSLDGWNRNGNAVYDSKLGVINVSVLSPLTQNVPVIAGQRFKNSVISRCLDVQIQGRIQVNWHDAKGKFLGTNIELFDCKYDWEEYSAELVAPDKAVNAEVYATAHSTDVLQFRSVSFKR